ncbi:Helix-loop-helix DNA-binding domain protein [Ditylenchus destructor]|uniref:Helix-loop-helix DNA-binding domain protein n=1 Tax=Ditylenchus destructor TaxID=166010 RepID=A0AAD4N2X8_9BILA|nr:Helix-loop-helix DNA-binding domain protein [Ditylenchus destructor]
MADKGHDLMFQNSGNFINECKKEFGNDENQMPGSYSGQRDAPGPARPTRKSSGQPKRKKQPWKEQQRNLEIKEALSTLSRSMPFVSKELTRIRTLRLAKAYINHLKKILEGEMVECKFTGKLRPVTLSDFEQVVNEEMQINNSYKERAEEEISLDTTRASSLSQNYESPSPTTPTTTDPKQGRKRTPNLPQIKQQPPSTSPMEMQFANNFCANNFSYAYPMFDPTFSQYCFNFM